jgi:sugar phosphate isomerase/epimerase
VRIGCSTIPLAPLSGETALRTLAALGFEVVDIAAVPTAFDHILVVDPPADQPERFAALVHQLGLEVNGVPTVTWGPDKRDDLEELRRRCTAAADVAVAVGAKAWTVDAGAPVGGDRAAGLERFKRTLEMQKELAEERGLRLTVEAPHKGTLAQEYEGVADVVAVGEELGADLWLALDTSHIHNSGAPARRAIADAAGKIGHVAIRDTVGPGQMGMRLGEGHVDVAGFVEELRASGFDGDLMLELEPHDVTVEERIELIEHGRAYLEEILARTPA